MTRPIKLQSSAVRDVREAVAWFNDQAPGLGADFLLALNEVFRLIAQFPDIHRRLNATCHHAFMRRFPYTVVYRMRPDVIQVVAVMHQRSNPKRVLQRAKIH